MKLFVLALAALALVACSEADEVGSARSGNIDFKEICIDGVVYLMLDNMHKGYMSPKFNTESKVVVCERPRSSL